MLQLPYDVRYEIYKHLFPQHGQVYIQVLNGKLRSILPDESIPAELLRTCRALYAECGAYFYNRYLFNVIGSKTECLNTYGAFLAIVQKHARAQVYTHALSNGSHSTTMCVSIHAGEAAFALLQRRGRGEPKEIRELQREVASQKPQRIWLLRYRQLALAACVALLALLIVAITKLGRFTGGLTLYPTLPTG